MGDTIKNGIIAGFFGTLGDTLIHITAYLLFGATTTGHYISILIFPFQTHTTMITWAIGELAHFVAGAAIGVLFFMLFKNFGFDHGYYKGVGLGLIFWLVHVAVIPNMVSPMPIVYRSVTETLVDLAAHAMYGFIVTAYLSKIASRL